MRVKIQQVLPQGFDKIEPHSWECELYKEDKNGQILVPIDAKNCREKGIKDMKIGDFVAVRLDEKSGKTGTIAGQIVEFVDEKGEKSLDTAINDELCKDEKLLLDMSLQAYLRGDFGRVEALRKVFLNLPKDKRKNAEQFDKEALNAFANSKGETIIQAKNDENIAELKREISRLKDELAKTKQEVDKKVWQGQRNLSLAFNDAMCEKQTLKDKLTRLEKIPAVKDLLEFETRLNSLWIARCKANDELLAFAAELDNLGYTFEWSDKNKKQFEIHKKGESDDN